MHHYSMREVVQRARSLSLLGQKRISWTEKQLLIKTQNRGIRERNSLQRSPLNTEPRAEATGCYPQAGIDHFA